MPNYLNRNAVFFLAASIAAILPLATLFTPMDAAPNVVFNVTTTADANDGACTGSLCTLSDAVIAANGAPGATINVPAGTYSLTLGALTVSSSMTISGAGAISTTVDAGCNSQVFNITAGTVTISSMTIRRGFTGGVGGGVSTAGNLTLDSVILRDNHASNAGGGVVAWTVSGMTGTLTLINSTVISNLASGAFGKSFNIVSAN